MDESIRKGIEKTKTRLDLLEEIYLIETEFRLIQREFEQRKADIEWKMKELEK